MRKLLSLLLMLCLLPVGALATPTTPYDAGLMLRYFTLSDVQRAIFDQCYDAAVAGETEVTLPANTAYTDAAAAMNALLADCPELCSLDNHYSLRYYQNAPEIAVSVQLSYTLPLAYQTVLMQQAQRIVSQASGDAYSRELFLHDALCSAATYDLTTAAQATAYGALVEGRAGCEGYARALILLCRMAGIPCGLVTGTALANGRLESHGWCVLSIGGSFTLTDPTWNDQDSLGEITHWYFNLSDEQMNADHQSSDDLILPPCTDESISWHAKNGMIVPEDGAAAQQLILSAMRQFVLERTPVNLRFATAAQAQSFVENLEGWFDTYNVNNADALYWGSYGVSLSDTQGCVLLMRRD